MALISIRELHIHVEVKEFSTESTKQIISKLNNIINNMATKAEIQAVIDEITASAANISADLDRIAEQVSGGLTAAEADEVAGQLTALSSNLKAIADRNPEPETPTEPEPTPEG